MVEPTSGSIHPAIAAVAVDALGRMGEHPTNHDSRLPVAANTQLVALNRIVELGGPSELLLAGRNFERFHEFPLFLVLFNSDSVSVLLEKIAQLNRYLHSHRRHEVRRSDDGEVELEHVSIRGPAPHVVESLFVSL